MLPHRFKKQLSGRPIRPGLVNQTLDDVRRLAISLPSPGFGGMGTPGGLLTFLNSVDVIYGITTSIVTAIHKAESEGSEDYELGQGTVNRLGVSVTAAEGVATLSSDEAVELRVYNVTGTPVPEGVRIYCRKLWNLWVIIPPATDVFQFFSPPGGIPAASGAFPYSPKKITADVYTNDGNPTLLAEDATIWNTAPVAINGNKATYVKVNPDGSFTVTNQVC